MENTGEQFKYVSSAPLLVGTDTVKAIDEEEIGTIEKVMQLLRDREASYDNIASLSLEDPKFTIEQQLAINQRVLLHLQELESLLTSTINKVREKQQNGQQY